VWGLQETQGGSKCTSAAARPPTRPRRSPSSWPGPNEVSKLLGPAKWSAFYLYVILDIYSRYVPGWMLARAENAALAKVLLAETVAKHGIAEDQLTLHSDRGSPMTAKPFVFLMADLGVTRSPTRPTTTPLRRASSAP
jgi:transposase InsO family protein